MGINKSIHELKEFEHIFYENVRKLIILLHGETVSHLGIFISKKIVIKGSIFEAKTIANMQSSCYVK